jgi:hypothetical protein
MGIRKRGQFVHGGFHEKEITIDSFTGRYRVCRARIEIEARHNFGLSRHATCTERSVKSMKKQAKSVPLFSNEAEERAFWESHDTTDYLDWSQAQKAVLPKLKPSTQTISLHLPQHLLDSIKR